MWITIGPSSLAGLAVVILIVPVNGFLLVKHVRKLQVSAVSFETHKHKFWVPIEILLDVPDTFWLLGKTNGREGQTSDIDQWDFIWHEGKNKNPDCCHKNIPTVLWWNFLLFIFANLYAFRYSSCTLGNLHFEQALPKLGRRNYSMWKTSVCWTPFPTFVGFCFRFW